MRVLIVTTDFLPNVSGIASLCYEQAAGLAALGHNIRLLTTTPGAENQTGDGAFSVKVYCKAQKPVLRLLQLHLALAQEITSFKPDVIWCANYRGFGLPVALLSHARDIPYGIYIHGTELITEHNNALRRSLFRQVARHANLISTNSQFTASLLREKYGLSGVPVTPGVFPPPVETARLVQKAASIRQKWLKHTPAPLLAEKIIFMSSCRITREKGIHHVIEAINLLPTEIKARVLYVVGGSGPAADDFKQLSRELNLEAQVIFNGSAAREDLPAILRAADVYLQPSQPHNGYIEGFGISFLEAQSVGLPCIASDWAGIPEAINRDKTGILIPPASPKAIAATIERVVKDAEWRHNASKEAVRWASGNSWTNHAARLEPLITKMAKPA